MPLSLLKCVDTSAKGNSKTKVEKLKENETKTIEFCLAIQPIPLSQLPSGYEHPLGCRGRQTTAQGGCNVHHKHDKISMKISKCAMSK